MRTYEPYWREIRYKGFINLQLKHACYVPRVKRMLSKEKDEDTGFRYINKDTTWRLIFTWTDADNKLLVQLQSKNLVSDMQRILKMSATNSTVTATLNNADIVKQRIKDLQVALQQNAPNYDSILHTIHRALAEDESTVHLLSEDEIGTIVAGLSKRTNVVLVENALKSGRGKKPTYDDL